jgi:hypothetical protein
MRSRTRSGPGPLAGKCSPGLQQISELANTHRGTPEVFFLLLVELTKRWSVTVAVELMQAMPSILIVFLTALGRWVTIMSLRISSDERVRCDAGVECLSRK